MFKKTLLVAALALTATGVASANGFYAGLGVGGSSLTSQDSYTTPSSNTSVDTGKIGVLGNLFGGYNFNFDNQMNLGIEAFAGADSAKVEANAGSFSVSDQLRYNYGVRMLPGYQITADTDLHLLAGYTRGNFKFSTSTGYSTNKNANGYQVGFGSTTSVNSNFAVRGDIIYSGYKSVSTGVGTNGDSATAKASTLDGVVSGEYKFG